MRQETVGHPSQLLVVALASNYRYYSTPAVRQAFVQHTLFGTCTPWASRCRRPIISMPSQSLRAGGSGVGERHWHGVSAAGAHIKVQFL